MGSPMVFQTAPPQPASKARMTWPPVLVGGPEASQKGLGLVTPANFTVKSAIVHQPSLRDAVSGTAESHLKTNYPGSEKPAPSQSEGCGARSGTEAILQ